jgi:hypothetical protein
MLEIKEIPGIDSNAAALLDMAGIRDAKHLGGQNAEKLLEKLRQANEIFHFAGGVPDQAILETWIQNAILAASHGKGQFKSPSLESAVNYEGIAQVLEMLGASPCAIPLPGKFLAEKKIRVSDIPAGLLLNRYSGDLDLRVVNPELSQSDLPKRRQAGSTKPDQRSREKIFDVAAVQTIRPDVAPVHRVVDFKQGSQDERVALICTPLESTNRGKLADSRRFVRGILHPHPWRLRLGAFFALILLPLLPTAVISGFLLLLSSVYPESFFWVPKGLLAFPIALPVIGLGYLFWGVGGKCRVCGQKIFVHKKALKHGKAHRFLRTGFIVPLSIHLLLFSWFRCSSCGTPVRLKK